MLNCACVQGRLTKDPETFKVGEREVCEFSIANNIIIGKNEDGSKKEIVHFLDIRVWGAQAKACQQYLSKGRMVVIEGEMTQQRWEKDGKKNSRVVIVSKNVIFLGGKGKREEDDESDDTDEDSV